jgi:hypothetical protein
MSGVIVIAPVVVASWPAIAAAVTAAVGSLGFAVTQAVVKGEQHVLNRAEIEVPDSEILAGTAGTEQQIVVEREGLRAIFSRDARGALKVCMEGAGYSQSQLRQLGEEVLGAVTQQYVYHRIVSELKDRHMAIVDEQVEADRTVRIRVRNNV